MKQDIALATFLDRLRDGTLTNVEQYRRMKTDLDQSSDGLPSESEDEWERWELVSVTSGRYSDSQRRKVRSESAGPLQRALSQLDS